MPGRPCCWSVVSQVCADREVGGRAAGPALLAPDPPLVLDQGLGDRAEVDLGDEARLLLRQGGGEVDRAQGEGRGGDDELVAGDRALAVGVDLDADPSQRTAVAGAFSIGGVTRRLVSSSTRVELPFLIR